MPRGLMDDLEGEVIGKEVHECALGHDVLAVDLGREDTLLDVASEALSVSSANVI